MSPGSNAAARVTLQQQLLRHFATLSVGDAGGGVEGELCIPATSALQDTCCQTTIIQERETEGDSSTAKYSALPVCFVPSLSPAPLCPQPLPSLRTGSLSIPDVLVRFCWLEFSKVSTQCAAHSKILLFRESSIQRTTRC